MISIVVPCYNAYKSLYETVTSLCEQKTCISYEIVLVDDGSADGTGQLCNDLAAGNTKVRVIHQRNTGLIGAWKRGVVEAYGDRIAFCDADDRVDSDFIERIDRVIGQYDPDIILFGMTVEYSDGKQIKEYNRLPGGYYDEPRIKKDILPNLLSDGGMQSELILHSRWSKVFRKQILMSIMDNISDGVSIGEDLLTTFAAAQVANSIYCMGDFSPYHYIRNSDSMIGQFDNRIFEKLHLLFDEMWSVAETYAYEYDDQILNVELSLILLNVKKYICRTQESYIVTRPRIRKIRESLEAKRCLRACSTTKYDFSARLFAELFRIRAYMALYYMTRLIERVRGRNI